MWARMAPLLDLYLGQLILYGNLQLAGECSRHLMEGKQGPKDLVASMPMLIMMEPHGEHHVNKKQEQQTSQQQAVGVETIGGYHITSLHGTNTAGIATAATRTVPSRKNVHKRGRVAPSPSLTGKNSPLLLVL